MGYLNEAKGKETFVDNLYSVLMSIGRKAFRPTDKLRWLLARLHWAKGISPLLTNYGGYLLAYIGYLLVYIAYLLVYIGYLLVYIGYLLVYIGYLLVYIGYLLVYIGYYYVAAYGAWK